MIDNDFSDESAVNKKDDRSATSFFDNNNAKIENDNEFSISKSSENEDDINKDITGLESSETSNLAQNLPADAKRALVSLMHMGSITFNQKPKLFEHICKYEKFIQEHLSNMYLRLMLDTKAGVAIVLQQEVVGDDEEDIYTLISRRTLSLYDTLLLLVLRKFYQERESSGEQRIVIDVERIETYLTPFLSITNSSRSDKRTLNSSLKKMTDRKILSSIRGEDGRYEITPVIRYVVNAEFLERLLEEYIELAKESEIDSNDKSEFSSSNINDEANSE